MIKMNKGKMSYFEYIDELTKMDLSYSETLLENKVWLLHNGLFSRMCMGSDIPKEECAWDINSMCGNILYTINEMMHSNLITGGNFDTQYVENMREKMNSIEKRIEHLHIEEEADVYSRHSDLLTIQMHAEDFHLHSMEFFKVLQIESNDLTPVSVFQGHQRILFIMLNYLRTITKVRHGQIESADKYVRHGLYSQTICTDWRHPLQAMFGTVIYATHRIQTKININRGEESLDSVLHFNKLVIATHKAIRKCNAEIPSEHQETLDSIEVFRNCVLAVHHASIYMMPVVYRESGMATAHEWTPLYMNYQLLLFSVCQQLDGLK
jgi:hypothetical protein